jgi:hypothetical protein
MKNIRPYLQSLCLIGEKQSLSWVPLDQKKCFLLNIFTRIPRANLCRFGLWRICVEVFCLVSVFVEKWKPWYTPNDINVCHRWKLFWEVRKIFMKKKITCTNFPWNNFTAVFLRRFFFFSKQFSSTPTSPRKKWAIRWGMSPDSFFFA